MRFRFGFETSRQTATTLGSRQRRADRRVIAPGFLLASLG